MPSISIASAFITLQGRAFGSVGNKGRLCLIRFVLRSILSTSLLDSPTEVSTSMVKEV